MGGVRVTRCELGVARYKLQVTSDWSSVISHRFRGVPECPFVYVFTGYQFVLTANESGVDKSLRARKTRSQEDIPRNRRVLANRYMFY